MTISNKYFKTRIVKKDNKNRSNRIYKSGGSRSSNSENWEFAVRAVVDPSILYFPPSADVPWYYCDYCDTYLTHDSPSVRKQHNAGYKHKANVRDYYMQYEAQQNQYLIDQRIKAHLGQTAPYQQVGAVFNQMRPRLPVLPNPMMPPMQGGPMPSPLMSGIRPPVFPRPGYAPGPGMPTMASMPPDAPGLPGQVNGLSRPMTMNPPPMVPGGTPSSIGLPQMFAPPVYQATSQAAPTSGGFDSSNMSTQPQASDGSH